MPFCFFVWDGENERHLAEHDVTIEEFAEVVCDPDRLETSRSSGRPIAFGYTSTGKYLACVYELFDDDTVYALVPARRRNESWYDKRITFAGS